MPLNSLDICANYSIRSIYEFHAYFHSFTSEPPLLGLNYNLNKTNKFDASAFYFKSYTAYSFTQSMHVHRKQGFCL